MTEKLTSEKLEQLRVVHSWTDGQPWDGDVLRLLTEHAALTKLAVTLEDALGCVVGAPELVDCPDTASVIRDTFRAKAMSETREPIYWSCDEDADDGLQATDPDDAIQTALDEIDAGDPVSETLTLYGWARMVPRSAEMGNPLTSCLENLDSVYGADYETTVPTPGMLAARNAFTAVVLSEYKSWACEVVCKREVNVAAWLADNETDSLDK